MSFVQVTHGGHQNNFLAVGFPKVDMFSNKFGFGIYLHSRNALLVLGREIARLNFFNVISDCLLNAARLHIIFYKGRNFAWSNAKNVL